MTVLVRLEARSAILLVPSYVARIERNVVINPAHVDAAGVDRLEILEGQARGVGRQVRGLPGAGAFGADGAALVMTR